MVGVSGGRFLSHALRLSSAPPPQHAWPALHAEPDVPQAHTPAVQLSPSAHARPIEPQFIGSVSVLTQVNEPLPSATHDWPEAHWS